MADLEALRKAVRDMTMEELHEANHILRDELQLRRRAEQTRAAVNFRIGDRVSFGGEDGRRFFGVVAKVNPTTLAVEVDRVEESGRERKPGPKEARWRVGPTHARKEGP